MWNIFAQGLDEAVYILMNVICQALLRLLNKQYQYEHPCQDSGNNNAKMFIRIDLSYILGIKNYIY